MFNEKIMKDEKGFFLIVYGEKVYFDTEVEAAEFITECG